MMKEHTFYRSVDTSVPSEQPNFDDERALRSARPVVPLAKIEAKDRRRRHWLLGGAFALAMMLGAGSAMLASYLKLRNLPSAASEISVAETQAARVAVASEPDEGESPLAEEAEAASSIKPKTVPVAKRSPADKPNTIVRPRTTREMGEEDELEKIREAVLIEEWQERRSRRAAQRERKPGDKNNRDLSNLDEIFEGRRRP